MIVLPTDLSKEIPVAIWSMLSERIRSMLDLSLTNVYLRGYQDATRQAREDINELLYPKPLPVLGAEEAAMAIRTRHVKRAEVAAIENLLDKQ